MQFAVQRVSTEAYPRIVLDENTRRSYVKKAFSQWVWVPPYLRYPSMISYFWILKNGNRRKSELSLDKDLLLRIEQHSSTGLDTYVPVWFRSLWRLGCIHVCPIPIWICKGYTVVSQTWNSLYIQITLKRLNKDCQFRTHSAPNQPIYTVTKITSP